MNLEELIVTYAENKSEMDSYKKLVNRDNALIKELMQEQQITEKEVDGWQAKITTKKSESFNEDKLLAIAKERNLDIIRTKEYVDTDIMEELIYNGVITKEDLLEIAKAKEVKETIELRVKKVKKGE